MAVEMAIWRVEGDKAAPLTLSPMDSERRLEDMVAEDPAALTGTDLLIIGRQVKTDFGGVVDLLGLDDEGRVHVLELKRDKTRGRLSPRRSTTGRGSRRSTWGVSIRSTRSTTATRRI
ncbi:MAG: DUF91 domain-containing protein [Acidimicrobiaceae bacterium]|nr:endonuclease NucS [Rhodospirillales bacterium]MYH44351.1 DUF91 domain-containing protein [Acidimicrobiaceae bacterium]MYK75228.1 DUF91 domain-containing protein [Acidimicrobiaceae bacterium]